LNKQLELFGRIENLTDERYATSAGYTQARGEELAPGLPRTLYAGVSYHWE
jgi:outer membrane receptor protein involved in Fe transport